MDLGGRYSLGMHREGLKARIVDLYSSVALSCVRRYCFLSFRVDYSYQEAL